MKAYERLIKYAKYPTVSDGTSDTCPSTTTQLKLGKALVEEMLEIGIKDAYMDENGYVYGTIPATKVDATGPVIGFVAHMDVASDAPCAPCNPQVIRKFDGHAITMLSGDVMTPEEYPCLKEVIGHDLVTTDGNTLLGADDKAGIAEILTMAEYLVNHPEFEHGTIKIGFTPDEEIGRGADLFDVEKFGADFAYTVDGDGFGAVEYETFNAISADIIITGRSIHPGDAKNIMINASQVAMELNSMLPALERPEFTEEREGFYHLVNMSGTCEQATMHYILRDHDLMKVHHKADTLRFIASYLNQKYGEGTVQLTIKEWYKNMEEIIRQHWHLIDIGFQATSLVGGTPRSKPVRGGTDGAVLSFKGLPCPNIGTGAFNAHSRFEFASVQLMDKVVQTLIVIAKLYTDYEVKR